MPWVKLQFFDDDGDPAAGYQLFAYQAGTTTKQATWSDQALTVPNANPIVLDSAGRASVFLAALMYRFKLATPTAADPPAGGDTLWDVDDIAPLPYHSVSSSVTRVGTEIGWGLSGADLTLIAPHSPVIASNYYVNAATTSTAVDIPAGTLHNGTSTLASVICEWECDYASADLDMRATVFGTNKDGGCGANSTLARAKYHMVPVSNTEVSVSQTVWQNTGGGAVQIHMAHSTIASLNLTTTGYQVILGMASGTYTIRGARVYILKNVTDLLG